MKVNCDHCDKVFDAYPYKIKRQKNIFCSTECQYAFKRNRVDLVCKICDTHFRIAKYRTLNQKECFCSRKCSNVAATKSRQIKKCIQCSKDFEFLPSRNKHSNVKFCSKECCQIFKKPSENWNCIMCNKPFNRVQSKIDENKGKYCSRICFLKDSSGRSSPNYKNGTSFFKNFSKLSRSDVCGSCRNNSKTDVHHIDGDPFNNVESNFISLCRSCHMRTHAISGSCSIDIKKALQILRLIVDLPKSDSVTKLLVGKLALLSLVPVELKLQKP